jgi:carbon storage regulator
MLYLTRKIGESVVINENIEITVVEVRGKSIKLGFTFPPEVTVLRREIHERIQAENRAAAAAGGTGLADILRRSDPLPPGRTVRRP